MNPCVPGFTAGGTTETEDDALIRVDVERAPRANPAPPGRPRVLVVDDDDLVLGMLRTGLERHGFRVWVAAGGAEAMAAGAFGFVQKPFRMRQVRPILDRALAARRAGLANSQ